MKLGYQQTISRVGLVVPIREMLDGEVATPLEDWVKYGIRAGVKYYRLNEFLLHAGPTYYAWEDCTNGFFADPMDTMCLVEITESEYYI